MFIYVSCLVAGIQVV